MAEWSRPVSQKVTTRVQVRSRTIFFPAPARICIAACFASASLLCIAASASKSMQIAMQFVTSWSASLLHRFCIAKPPQTPSLINPWSDADCNADGKNRCRILHRSSASYLHRFRCRSSDADEAAICIAAICIAICIDFDAEAAMQSSDAEAKQAAMQMRAGAGGKNRSRPDLNPRRYFQRHRP